MDDYLVKEMMSQWEDDYSSDYSTVDLVVGEMDHSFGLYHGSDTIINCWCRVWGCKTLFVNVKGIKYRLGKTRPQYSFSPSTTKLGKQWPNYWSDFSHCYNILWAFFLLSVQCFSGPQRVNASQMEGPVSSAGFWEGSYTKLHYRMEEQHFEEV